MKISALINKLKKLETLQPDAEVGIICGVEAFEIESMKLEVVVAEDDSVVSIASINATKV